MQFNGDDVALAVFEPAASGHQLRHCETFSLPPELDRRTALMRERVQALSVRGAQCRAVLPAARYNLQLIEAPRVDPSELRAAMRWRVKDLIDFHIDDAVIDVFDLPQDASRSGQNLMYVVAARQVEIERTIHVLEGAELQLASIDIADLALRNLALYCPDRERGVGIVQLDAGSGSLVLLRNDQLYLARHFELDFGGGLLDELPEDQLVLELQRSLDYFERQQGQVPPASLYFVGGNMTDDKLSPGLRGGLAAEVRLLDLSSWIPMAEGLDDEVLQTCATAIGAGLRHEEVTL